MSYKILTKNGVDNTNIDGARGEYFNSGMRDGIVQGVLNEGLFTASPSNTILLDTCELRIAGHRIVIDAPVYHTFSNAISNDTRYSYVAQIVVDDNRNVDFSLFVQTSNTPLIQNDLYKTIKGSGIYQVEIGKFTLLTTLEVVDIVRTIDIITGGGEKVNNNDYIKIGEVTTTMLDSGLDAEVNIENVINENTGETETNFDFFIPKSAGSIVNVAGEQVASVNFTSDPQTQINTLNTNINTLDTNKLDKNGDTITGTYSIDTGSASDNLGFTIRANNSDVGESSTIKNRDDALHLGFGTAGIISHYKDFDNMDTFVSASAQANVGFIVSIGTDDCFKVSANNKKTYVFNGLDIDGGLTIAGVSLLDKIYPIDSVYISVNNTSPASFIGGTWTEIEAGMTLWTTTTEGEGGQTIEAGLPNIQGTFRAAGYENSDGFSGAFSKTTHSNLTLGTSGGSRLQAITFDASDSNRIYGNSETVQPPAIRVYAWQRVS